MTEDNRRKNIAAEVRRGDESLDSAQLLLDAHKLADAVSRAYYAPFHVGVHAAVGRMNLLTRDARRYRTYFPTLEIIEP